MPKTFTIKALSFLLISSMLFCMMPQAKAAETESFFMDFEAESNDILPYWIQNGAGTVELYIETDNNSALCFYGGGKSIYNKVYTNTIYSGDITLSFDVLFKNTSKNELFCFTARYNSPNTETTDDFREENAWASAVLNDDPSGLWLYYGTNSKSIDVSFSTNDWNRTDTWYSIKYTIEGTEHKIKIWQKGDSEPESWSCSATIEDAPMDGSVAFFKKGNGYVLIDNINVALENSIEGINADVNSDGDCNAEDLAEMRKILLCLSDIEFFDVNGDNYCDIRDLVALKKYFTWICI